MKSFIRNLGFQKRIILIFAIVLCFILLGCETKEEFYSGETNYEYDDQTFFYDTHNIAKTNDGYYFFSINNHLMFFGKDSDKAIPVCSRINCSHTDDACDAYFEFLADPSLWYYDNQLYLILYDINSYTYSLSSISLDGSKRARHCDLLKIEVVEEEGEDGHQFGGDISRLAIHRGHAYYIINNSDQKPELRKIQLKKNAKPEIIYTGEDANSYISRIKGFEDHIYFQGYTITDSSTLEVSSNMYDYNILTEEISVCIEDSILDFIPMSDKIYFMDSEGINLYTFGNSQTELVYESNTPYALSFDGEYFYCDNIIDSMTMEEERSIFVFDESFHPIDQIYLDTTYQMCSFGDRDYLFCSNSSDKGVWMEVFGKSQIGIESSEWIKLE